MADFADELITYLKTRSGVTDLVGTGTAARIFHDRLRQGATLPAVFFVETGGDSAEHLGGIAGMARAFYQLYSCGATRTAANDMAEAVRLAPLQGYRGLMGATYVQGVNASAHRNTGFKEAPGTDLPAYYWTLRAYEIWHVEPTS